LDCAAECEFCFGVDDFGFGFHCFSGLVEGEALALGRNENERMFAILTLCGIIGILFAIVEQLLYNNGIIINQFLSGGSLGVTMGLREVQFATILAWEIFGLVLAAVTT